MLVDIHKLRETFKHGDEIWACAFDYNYSKEGKYLYQKPIKGIFTVADAEARCNRMSNMKSLNINYFVPYRKDGKGLAWSKAVLIWHRAYATTEQECRCLYNDLIQKNITWHQEQIEALEKELVAEI